MDKNKIKLLIGGFPCVKFSVAQKKNREIKPYSGIGWELFSNYLIAKEKFKPDFFFAENNQSISQEIKDEVSKLLGVDYVGINSALMSAQTRKRIYWMNSPVDIPQPEDKGILLKDILQFNQSVVEKEKAYCLCTDHVGTTRDYFKKHESQIVFEPVCVAQRGRYNAEGKVEQHYEPRLDGKTNTITTVQKDNLIAEPVRVGDIGSNSQAHRVYSCYGKSVNLVANGGGQGAKTGLYFTPLPDELVGLVCDKGKIYEIVDGYIETKVGRYKCNMPDGHYIIRKLTPTECARLQTMPDDYAEVEGVSNTQKYKCYGNSWTADVIIYMWKHLLKDIPRDTPLEVLSMYDGIATGLYCLKKMGFTNIKYYATEIDPYAIKIALHNHPEIIELGDAFQVREDDWSLSE